MAKDKNKAAVAALIEKAVQSHHGQQAIQFTQAACNVANVMVALKHAALK